MMCSTISRFCEGMSMTIDKELCHLCGRNISMFSDDNLCYDCRVKVDDDQSRREYEESLLGTNRALCYQCDKTVDVYWELETCEKNPEGLIPEPIPHGNIVGDMETCEDDYCNPYYETVDNDLINDEYIKTHEVHERCCECDQFMECQ